MHIENLSGFRAKKYRPPPLVSRAIARRRIRHKQLHGLGKFRFKSVIRAMTAPVRIVQKKIVAPVAKKVEQKVWRPVMRRAAPILAKIAPVISFIPGVGTAAAAIISLGLAAEKMRQQRVAKRKAGEETAALDREIAATEAKIAELEKLPPVASAAATSNSIIGAETAAAKAEADVTGTAAAKAEADVTGAPKKPVPWGLLAAGATAAFALLK